MNWKGSKDYFSTVVNIGMSLMLGVNFVTSAVGMKGNICELVQIIQVWYIKMLTSWSGENHSKLFQVFTFPFYFQIFQLSVVFLCPLLLTVRICPCTIQFQHKFSVMVLSAFSVHCPSWSTCFELELPQISCLFLRCELRLWFLKTLFPESCVACCTPHQWTDFAEKWPGKNEFF